MVLLRCAIMRQCFLVMMKKSGKLFCVDFLKCLHSLNLLVPPNIGNGPLSNHSRLLIYWIAEGVKTE